MHPVIRIVCLVLLAAFLARGQGAALVFAFLPLGVWYVRTGGGAWREGWRRVRRIRWLLLTLFIVYGWFTPGQPLLDAGAAWLPTREGLREGGLRAAGLVAIVLAVDVLLRTTSRDQLVGALYWLFAPLRGERLAVRMVLTLEAVAQVQDMVRAAKTDMTGAGGVRARAGRAVAGLFQTVIARAEAAPCAPVEVPAAPRPGWMQWLWPALLAGVMYLVSR